MAVLSAVFMMRVRRVCLGLTGLVCLAYAIGAMALGRPDPISAWVPGVMGVMAAVLITVTAFAAGRRNAVIASDELHKAVDHRAQRYAYWFALALYPAFGILLSQDLVDMRVAFASMGTLTGAAYLLGFTYLDMRNA